MGVSRPDRSEDTRQSRLSESRAPLTRKRRLAELERRRIVLADSRRLGRTPNRPATRLHSDGNVPRRFSVWPIAGTLAGVCTSRAARLHRTRDRPRHGCPRAPRHSRPPAAGPRRSGKHRRQPGLSLGPLRSSGRRRLGYPRKQSHRTNTRRQPRRNLCLHLRHHRPPCPSRCSPSSAR